jgi:hypothetical protein
MAGVAVVAGGAALILNRRLNMVEGHIVGKAAASPKPLPPPDQT